MWHQFGIRTCKSKYMKKLYMLLMVFAGFFSSALYAQQFTKYAERPAHVSIFPNPSPGSYFFIQNDSSALDHFDQVLIYNSNGVLLQNKQLQVNRGTTKQQIDIPGYEKGIYYVRIVNLKDPSLSFTTQLMVD